MARVYIYQAGGSLLPIADTGNSASVVANVLRTFQTEAQFEAERHDLLAGMLAFLEYTRYVPEGAPSGSTGVPAPTLLYVRDKDDYVVLDAPLTWHYLLNGREDADAHPVSAITGLATTLDGLAATDTELTEKVAGLTTTTETLTETTENLTETTDGLVEEVSELTSVTAGLTAAADAGGAQLASGAFVDASGTPTLRLTTQNPRLPAGSDTSVVSVVVPLADAMTAGFMSSSDVVALAALVETVDALQGRAVRYPVHLASNTSPTQAQLTTVWGAASGLSGTPGDGTTLVDLDNNTVYTWFATSSVWVARGSDTVSLASNTALGVVMGTAGVPGKVYVETNGTLSLVGWDALVTDVGTAKANVSALQTTVSPLPAKVSSLEGRATSLETKASTLTTDVSGLKTTVSPLPAKVSSLEGRIAIYAAASESAAQTYSASHSTTLVIYPEP
jgi:uncharacterized protein YoxC